MAARFSFVFVMAVAMIASPFCLAQRGGFGGSGHFGSGFGAGHNGSSLFGHGGFGRDGFGRRRTDFGAYWGDPFFWYGDSSMPASAETESGPPVLIMRPDSPTQGRLSPLLIELEGDRYVRHGGRAQSGQTEASREPRTTPSPASDSLAAGETAELTPTMLVFRDGHREQASDYAIVGRVLYAHGNVDGEPSYGLRNIQISSLDLSATIKANRENGVRFVLPSGPNEVVTRP